MALFTSEQADACVFVTCESMKTDGVHTCWCIAVTDENGSAYEWGDKVLSGAATKPQVKTAALATLLTMEFKAVAPVKSYTTMEDIIGETVGS